ncbi:hypothetical protein PLICRDRAFT_181223 [Plicaturopsis crispa FD-325 SS-3]|uniref:Uncharacterized protein n=1 Tax=Plicaturopsis crispa FD-325 SS-3 TaxID=944288 RepID=A0A0C9SJV4_PLICR|nr:hypothetical protein PLICRDRAFT_181223 [Plicaturopsis crispa FD-325 SS-3]
MPSIAPHSQPQSHSPIPSDTSYSPNLSPDTDLLESPSESLSLQSLPEPDPIMPTINTHSDSTAGVHAC